MRTVWKSLHSFKPWPSRSNGAFSWWISCTTVQFSASNGQTFQLTEHFIILGLFRCISLQRLVASFACWRALERSIFVLHLPCMSCEDQCKCLNTSLGSIGKFIVLSLTSKFSRASRAACGAFHFSYEHSLTFEPASCFKPECFWSKVCI